MVFTRENLVNNSQLEPKEAVAIMTTLLPLPKGNETMEEISNIVSKSKADKYEIQSSHIDVWFIQDTYKDGKKDNYHFRYFFKDKVFEKGPVRIDD